MGQICQSDEYWSISKLVAYEGTGYIWIMANGYADPNGLLEVVELRRRFFGDESVSNDDVPYYGPELSDEVEGLLASKQNGSELRERLLKAREDICFSSSAPIGDSALREIAGEIFTADRTPLCPDRF